VDADDVERFLHRGRGYTDVDVVGTVLSHPKAARHVEHLRITLGGAPDAWDFLDQEIAGAPGIYCLLSLPSPETLRVLDLTRCNPELAPLALPRLATLRLRSCSVTLEDFHALVDAAPELATVHLDSVAFMPPPDKRFGVHDASEFGGLCFRHGFK
jgi:hypothetical protein